jgi:putative nucleotidyltransferase with HDIG domain
MSSAEHDPRAEELLRSAPVRAVEPLSARDRLTESGFAIALVAVVLAMALWLPAPKTSSLSLAALLLGVSVLTQRVRFTIGSVTLVPTQMVIPPMLLLLHPALVIVVVVLSGTLTRLPDYVRRLKHPDHVLFSFGDSWHVVGAALVLGLAGVTSPSFEHWPIYLGALAAQIAFDNVITPLRVWLALGVPPELQLRMQVIGVAIDSALAPIGLAIGLIATDHPGAVVLSLPLVALLEVLGREREQRIQHALDLSVAYRGSALLMGEMLEADDEYTGGEHSKGVGSLALTVGTELGLDAREQRELEFGALLHDIGKLRTPDEIINKPGKLTPAEWEIIKRHPIDGQEMLNRIGGMLADVGLVVRHHHERWDGGGYPDGLVGEAIPLAARIICACDAYSAMTTDRAYRKAMPKEVALTELRDCSGSQFDPRVVAAIERVVAVEALPRLYEALAEAA